MAHIYRFFASRIQPGQWRLDDEEVTHALKVLRLADGARIEVMDGAGSVGTGSLRYESKTKAVVSDVVESVTAKDPVTRHVVIGALKPGDIDELIAPLVELGVDKILVYRQDDTPSFRVNDSASERWQRLVRSALKQSKRPFTVSVDAFDSLDLALAEVSGCPHKWILLPEAEVDLLTVSTGIKDAANVAALIGGEKGFSAREEVSARKAGFQAVRLGAWVLRAKTAAPAAAVFLGMLPRVK